MCRSFISLSIYLKISLFAFRCQRTHPPPPPGTITIQLLIHTAAVLCSVPAVIHIAAAISSSLLSLTEQLLYGLLLLSAAVLRSALAVSHIAAALASSLLSLTEQLF